ncbi:ubiquitin-conjugating enzyme/RWD-like protein [Papiliotrema laurentii]|uniref:Ubiquitin-conjugating enzyme/RWD-like protein n=1 Tax=Papiliotrema laurentii TaxID=5418 RepID=A0AAD9CY27_PAPLA|nr:ubiquitin-conjugating enzyme/RWD-like protein [Papiliotrema laurentii]
MFGGRTGTPTKQRVDTPPPTEIGPLLASELAIEYASLRAAGNCPTGMYLTPSPDTLLKWHGVFFVHRGPYAGSILRFSLVFPSSFPQSGPTVRFDSDVFHPMVDPKTKIWHARGRLVQWKPRVDHVPHILHSLKGSFRTSSLDSIQEREAVNKQVWSLYQHSHQTFLSMTAQRALHSASRSTLYPASYPLPPVPASPTSKSHARQTSVASSVSKGEEGPIVFRDIGEEERKRLREGMNRSLGL